jgi:hypothetical protein
MSDPSEADGIRRRRLRGALPALHTGRWQWEIASHVMLRRTQLMPK